MIIAVVRVRRRTGIMKVSAKISFERKVAIVDSQTCFVFVPCDSSEMWMPRESERESAIAMVIIPPMTTSLEFVAEFNPIIKPRVVIIPEVKPKLNPVLMLFFIFLLMRGDLNKLPSAR